MNVIRECYQELFYEHGPALFEQSFAKQEPWQQALLSCHQVQLQPEAVVDGPVRVKGKKKISIPGGTVKLVHATCRKVCPGHRGSALFEPLESGLPNGLLASPALVNVTNGVVVIPITNVGGTDAVLPPRIQIGTLCQAEILNFPNVEAVREVQLSSQIATTVPQQVKEASSNQKPYLSHRNS